MKSRYLSTGKKTLILIIFIFLASCSKIPQEDNTPWMSLFNGKNLIGWTKKGGDAKYRVENSDIVGSTVHNTPNTFLATEKEYDDFILELDFKVDSSMNSGIQIRSNSYNFRRLVSESKYKKWKGFGELSISFYRIMMSV